MITKDSEKPHERLYSFHDVSFQLPAVSAVSDNIPVINLVINLNDINEFIRATMNRNESKCTIRQRSHWIGDVKYQNVNVTTKPQGKRQKIIQHETWTKDGENYSFSDKRQHVHFIQSNDRETEMTMEFEF